jgi:L-seryl-tRNA(Ser) seleniumtransferase
MDYLDPEQAVKRIPVLAMLFQSPETIRGRAKKIASQLRKLTAEADLRVIKDSSKAGGGSLPESEFETYAVAVAPRHISVNELETRLRLSSPPVIARIRETSLILDARTIQDHETGELIRIVASALRPL